jgi:hypothetical protein
MDFIINQNTLKPFFNDLKPQKLSFLKKIKLKTLNILMKFKINLKLLTYTFQHEDTSASLSNSTSDNNPKFLNLINKF